MRRQYEARFRRNLDGAAAVAGAMRERQAPAPRLSRIRSTSRAAPLIAALLMPASSLTVVLASWRSRTFDEARP